MCISTDRDEASVLHEGVHETTRTQNMDVLAFEIGSSFKQSREILYI